MVIPIIPPPFVPMHPSHSYFWSGSNRLDWCEERFTTNLMPQALSRFLVKFDKCYLWGRSFHIVNISHYYIGWNQANSTGIYEGVHPRLSRDIAFASPCRTIPHPLWWHHNSCLVFWPHAFTSTHQFSIIQIMYWCKMIKPILAMLCDLSG